MNSHCIDLHLVTDRPLCLGRKLLDIVGAAAQGGVSLVQLREKCCATHEIIELGRALADLLRPYGIPLLINDRVDVALAIGAAGVHIGQSDMPYPEARRRLGPNAIIGLSVESEAQARVAEDLDADYLGLSPVFATPTKIELTHRLGLEGVRRIRRISRHRLIAIGGLHSGNLTSVMQAGADGIAVVSAICSANDPLQATLQIRQQMGQAGACGNPPTHLSEKG